MTANHYGYQRVRGQLVRNGERRGWKAPNDGAEVIAPVMPDDNDETPESALCPPQTEDNAFRDLFDIDVRGHR